MQTYTLLTGASSGIGAAIARRLGGERALILSGRDVGKLREAAGLGDDGRHLLWPYDLRDVEGIQPSLGGLLEHQQAVVDCFVHCAGVVKVLPARLNEPAVVQEVMNVNVLSAMQILRTLLRKANHGALANVLFISSTYSIRGVKGQALYAASKGALDAMMQSLAVELAPAVRVNSVLPGGVKTPMSQRAFEDPQHLEKMKQEYLLRLGEVDDVVNVVEFMLSDKAGWITGQRIVVDGGQTAH
ncbi:MAG TPA: SDR family oxidoreductase [Kofleriaceae bacterium]|nr:SDR family oxidoreductase [Kofleriaceae bacterium]